MTLQIVLLAAVVAGVALAALSGGAARPSTRRTAIVCLALLIVSLQIVGVVSHTIVRHIVQCIPPIIALTLIGLGSAAGIVAAIPIFTFWAAVMIIIWLFLLDIARVVSGTFTPIEIAMTVVMGVACGIGIATLARSSGMLSSSRRVAIAVVFGIGQFAAMMLSFQPLFR